jgi:hypothetical protein
MFKDELEKYQNLYMQYVENMVDFHNQHQLFVGNVTVEAGVILRRELRRLTKMQKTLAEATVSVSNARRDQRKLEAQAVKTKKVADRKVKKEEQYGINSKRTKKTL